MKGRKNPVYITILLLAVAIAMVGCTQNLQTLKEYGTEYSVKAPIEHDTEWSVNDRLLVDWSHDTYWYPATISKIEGSRYYVVFDDGDEQWTTTDRMVPENLKPGDRVFANWKELGIYYPGVITERDGMDIHVRYDDGDEENTTISVLRVLLR